MFAILFADDSNFFCTGKDIDTLLDTVNSELEKIIKWLNANKMSLNIEKNHYIVFSQKGKCTETEKSLCMNGLPISRVTHTKFLGVQIDSNLTWKNHIAYICNKVAKNVGILIRTRKVFNSVTMRMLYYSMIYPYLSYCIHVWGCVFKTYMGKIVVIQKRIVRIICGVSRRTHSYPLFQALDILNVEKLYEYTIGLMMYKYHHSQLPDVIKNLFTTNYEIHNRSTRQSHLLHIPKCRTTLGERSFKHQATKIWNNLRENLNVDVKIGTYKKHLKSYLLNIVE